MTSQLDYFPIIEKWNGRTHDEEKSDRIRRDYSRFHSRFVDLALRLPERQYCLSSYGSNGSRTYSRRDAFVAGK